MRQGHTLTGTERRRHLRRCQAGNLRIVLAEFRRPTLSAREPSGDAYRQEKLLMPLTMLTVSMVSGITSSKTHVCMGMNHTDGALPFLDLTDDIVLLQHAHASSDRSNVAVAIHSALHLLRRKVCRVVLFDPVQNLTCVFHAIPGHWIESHRRVLAEKLR